MEKYFSVLRRCGLFEGIADESLSVMLNCLGAKVEHFEKRYTVFAEGKPVRQIGILLSGFLQVEQVDYYGNRTILSGVEPGELFGEAFACAETEACPVAVVANDESAVMLLDARHVLHTCANSCGFHQQLIFNLMKTLAVRNIMFHQKLEITSKRTTRGKLMAYLMLQAKKTGKSSFEIPFDRQELADFLEVDRSGLSNEIAKLRREGVLESEKKQFTLF